MTEKNTTKGDRYTYAWDRVKKATEHGCYLERIAIFESIMSDRLLSYIIGHEAGVGVKLSFFNLINKARSIAGGEIKAVCTRQLSWIDGSQELSSGNIFDDIDLWRQSRNGALHGITKCRSGESMSSPEEFEKKAREAAEQGEKLTRLLLYWHEGQLRKHQAENVG